MSTGPFNVNARHPSTEHMMKMLTPNENLRDDLLALSKDCHQLAVTMINCIEDSPELTAGLRKLLEAKDCFIRAAVDNDPVDYRDR